MTMNCFCGMVHRRKVFSFIFNHDHRLRLSPSQICNMPRAEFEPVQNQSLVLVKWSCAVIKTATPGCTFLVIFQHFCTLNIKKIYIYENFLIYCNAKRETLKRNFNTINKIVFQMMLEKETALNTVSQNRNLICLATILKINRTFGRGELFFLTRYKQKLYLFFLFRWCFITTLFWMYSLIWFFTYFNIRF